MQKIEKIDILSLIFMPFTGNKSPGAKKVRMNGNVTISQTFSE